MASTDSPASASTPKSFSLDPTLYLYTSLTAGSSHIITATSRFETILKANRIAFTPLDVATDEKARMLWGRRAGGKKLPGLVRRGMLVGDLEQVEEWNEYGELKENVEGPPAGAAGTPSGTPSKAPAETGVIGSGTPLKESSTAPTETPTKPAPAPARKEEEKPKYQGGSKQSSLTMAMKQVGEEAAKKAGQAKQKVLAKPREDQQELPPKPEDDDDAGTQKVDEETTEEVVRALDSSAPVVPPPIGTTDAATAMKGDTDAGAGIEKPKPADVTPNESAVEPSPAGSRSSLQLSGTPPGATPQHRGSNVSVASAEEIRNIEQTSAIPEETEEDGELERPRGVAEKADATKGEKPPAASERTQEQPAAAADQAGETVAD
ncbi:MAG: hypothetical protein M1833_004331 [Piccolia ochrophora]|nr:MAG: hypothetical protein M1833_004331 [Piccolia ochrophora]